MLTGVEIFSNTFLEFYLAVYFSFYNLCGKEYMCRKGGAQGMGTSHVKVRRQVAEAILGRLLALCGFRAWNSYCQAWQKKPLLAKLCSWITDGNSFN